MAGVVLENIRKSYGNVDVIKGVDLEINDGEFTVFVGPSGCGKSTLLRMIAGLEDISAGDMFIGEKRVNELPPKDRSVAMVFQSYAIFPHMTVRENIGFGLTIAKTPKAEKDSKVQEAARILQMEHLLDRRPSQLSGGQRQRVAIGRAITRKPEVFLFDEPLSNLDAALRMDMRMEIGKLHQQLGATMIYVTHDQVEAMTMADRMIVMNEGVAEQIGTPLEVYETPRTLFAAQFIGSPAMNIFDAEIDSGKVMFRDAVIGRTDVRDGNVKLGIRPEHLMPDDRGSLDVSLQIAEPLGANTLLHGRLAGDDQPITVSLAGVHRIEAEKSDKRFSVKPDDIHLFDPSTGMRLQG